MYYLKSSQLLYLLIFFMSSYYSSYSQDHDKQDEQEEPVEFYLNLTLEDLVNMEVSSASKFSQKTSEAPNIITAINKKQISTYGWLSTADILHSQPGYAPGQDYDRRTVAFRGMFEGWNNNRLLSLVDGIPFNDNLYGTAYTWEIMPLIFTKSMEVIRGPGGSLYGSNAMNGVITYNTLNASDLEGAGEARMRFDWRYGTKIYDVVTGAETDKFGVVLAYNNYETRGNNYMSLDNSYRTNANGNLRLFEVNDERSSSYFFSKIYGKNKLEGLSIQFHEQHWDYETGHGWLFIIPDEEENMQEFRKILAVRYAPRKEDRTFNYEITTRYQIHDINWNMRYFPKGDVWGWGYQNGLTEYLKTDAEDIFLRLQGDVAFGENIILFGLEGTRFLYDGDDAHNSTARLNDDWASTPNNEFVDVGPWFGYVLDKPVNNVAYFAQYITPKLFNRLQLTIGGRYDNQFFTYNEGGIPGSNVLNKSFNQFTPRVSAVYSATDNITLKAIYGQAFRTPTPTEMFGTNTYSLGSNIDVLESELVTNIDAAIEWKIIDKINIKANYFNVKFENRIAYGSSNLSQNINSPTTSGIELETNFTFGQLNGFINYSTAWRIDESIIDIGGVSGHSDEVVWAPASTMKLGLNYKAGDFSAALLTQYQGEVKRRYTDNPDGSGLDTYRDDAVPSWMNVDIRIAYEFWKSLEIGVIGNNLINSEQFLIRNAPEPFDYRRAERSIIADILFRF